MSQDFDHKGKREFLLVMKLIAVSFALGATLTGCSGWTTSASPQNSAVTHFGYTGSALAATLVPANNAAAVSNSYFGMTIHRLVHNPLSPSNPTAPFPPFPLHTLRLWDVVNWSSLEPTDGRYDWTTMDGTIAVAKQNGVSDFIFTLGNVPQWAYANPGATCGSGEAAGPCDAPDMRAFDDFVTHVVQRYCGVVQYYETWNEPNWGFWNGTNAQLLAVATQLYQIAKDPANCGCTDGVCSPGGGTNSNQVLLPSISGIEGNLSWLDSYLAAAGSNYPYADIVAFHGYGYAQPEDIAQAVPQLRKTLAKHGLSALELWDTEASWGISTTDDQQQEASWLMRFHIAQAASGVSRFDWYAYDNCEWGTLWGPACQYSSDNWQGLRLPGEAYGTLETWIAGATLTHCDEYQDGLWACELQRSGGYDGWILWDSRGTALSVPIPNQLQLTHYRDWRNNVNLLPQEITVDQMPVLLENFRADD
jgi:hypothetical protein